jgi:RNA 3'-phosphate cyclase
MIEIDGGIGGGQVLRSSLALSSLLGKPFMIKNIRQKRPSPGLKTQHITAVEAVAKLCDAEVDGLSFGSKELSFTPGEITSKSINLNIPTAGSIGLVLQAILPAAVFSEKRIDIHITGGGTSGKWSPPVPYMEDVLCKILSKFGADLGIETIKHGFYPKGGAEVKIRVNPKKINEINLVEQGDLIGIHGVCICSEHLQQARVAERIKISAMKYLEDAKIKTEYVKTLSPGVFAMLCAEFENTVIGADIVGERGISSENVGKQVADLLKSRMKYVLDEHAADNLIPFICVAGGRIKIPRETEHIKTNIQTCRYFGIDIKERGDMVWIKKT